MEDPPLMHEGYTFQDLLRKALNLALSEKQLPIFQNALQLMI
jgi:hypothetical protein